MICFYLIKMTYHLFNHGFLSAGFQNSASWALIDWATYSWIFWATGGRHSLFLLVELIRKENVSLTHLMHPYKQENTRSVLSSPRLQMSLSYLMEQARGEFPVLGLASNNCNKPCTHSKQSSLNAPSYRWGNPIPLTYIFPQYCPPLPRPSTFPKSTLYTHENIILCSFCICVCLKVNVYLQRTILKQVSHPSIALKAQFLSMY